ncbi:MAG: peptidase [Chitinophagaceae bacterium]|nr:MAG: peptidase [Chitinophagaceae bacterium]
MKSNIKKNYVLGRVDKIDLPDLELFDLDAKIDTGAYSSSIHCHNIEIEKVNGKEILKCNLLDPKHPVYNEKVFRFDDFTRTRVKSSNGQVQKRFLIRTDILLFGNRFSTDFTLNDRQEMKYPILLGRKLLRQGFVVDVKQFNRSFRRKSKLEADNK